MRGERDIPALDIWRAAKLLVDQHGADAPISAAPRADELLAAGDMDGHAVWLVLSMTNPSGLKWRNRAIPVRRAGYGRDTIAPEARPRSF